MSLWLLAVTMAAVVNPARARSALPVVDAARIGATGAAIAGLVLLPLTVGGRALVAQVDVAASTVRMGVALVLVLQGAVAIVTRPPLPEPGLAGRRAALVPVAFPVALTPGLGLLAMSGALDQSTLAAWAIAAAALLTIPVSARVVPTLSPVRARVLGGLGRATAAVLVLAGVALLMDGLFDI